MSKKHYISPELVKYRDEVVARHKANRPKERPKLEELKLNTTYIDKIMNKFILPKYKDIDYKLYKAQSTNSLYLQLKVNRADCWMRFSDHQSKKNIQTLDISEKEFNAGEVIQAIEVRIRGLYYKSKMLAFEALEKHYDR